MALVHPGHIHRAGESAASGAHQPEEPEGAGRPDQEQAFSSINKYSYYSSWLLVAGSGSSWLLVVVVLVVVVVVVVVVALPTVLFMFPDSDSASLSPESRPTRNGSSSPNMPSDGSYPEPEALEPLIV